MATAELVPTSVDSATGWTGATVANLATSDNNRATGGDAGEQIIGQLTNAPADFGSMNTITLRIEGRRVGTPSREKQFLVELLDAADSVLESFTTTDLTATDVVYSSSAFSRSDSQATIDGYKYRITSQEGGGMPDSVTTEIDQIRFTLDYTPAGAAPIPPVVMAPPVPASYET